MERTIVDSFNQILRRAYVQITIVREKDSFYPQMMINPSLNNVSDK